MASKPTSVRALSRALADAGVFPASMLDDILSITIKMDPGSIPVMQIDLAVDSRIYEIIDPRKSAVNVRGKADNDA